MKIKRLFTVPQGEKVTEKHLRRVLISSICSILLCMTCMVSTTWAWFTVSIENTGNEIQIATATASVQISPVAATDENGAYILNAGENYTVAVTVSGYDSKVDAFGIKGKMYVKMSAAVSGKPEQIAWFEFSGNGEQVVELTVYEGATLCFYPISWETPSSDERVGTALTLGEEPTEVTPESTDTSVTGDETDQGAEFVE